MTDRRYHARSRAEGRRRGVALLDLLVATAVALGTLALVSAALPPVLDVARSMPEAADVQQRARASEVILAGLIGSAGAGADLLGEGPLTQAIPALWPRRLLFAADAPDTAWADRLALLQVESRAAQAPVAAIVAVGSSSVPLAWHPACGTHPSCGFRRGDLVLVYSRTGAMTISPFADVQGLLLTLTTPADQSIGLPAAVAVVSVRTITFDAGRRQLRRADGLAASQPLTDDVVGVRVRYYGSTAAPRWPAVPGADTCAVLADGTPRLGLLGAVPGPPVELTVADFIDGPWCGAGVWRFDADLLRLRAVRLAIRLQAASSSVRGVEPRWFSRPGQARRPGQEVRDVELDMFVTAPNLAWAQ